MKKVLPLLFVIIGLAACKDQSEPPAATIDGMFSAMKTGNIQEMKNYITKQDVAMLDVAEQFLTKADPEGVAKIKTRMTEELKERVKDIQYSLSNEKIDGNHATVEAKITVKDSTGAPKTDTHTFELVKEENAWKLALTKPGNDMFNSMKGNLGARRGGLKEGLERFQKMDPDSVKMLIRQGIKVMDSVDKAKKQ